MKYFLLIFIPAFISAIESGAQQLAPVQAGEVELRLEPSNNNSFIQAYGKIETSPGTGLFLTSDLAFDTVHKFTEACIKTAELERLRPELDALLTALGKEAAAAAGTAPQGEAAEAARLVAGYLAVGRALLAGSAHGALGGLDSATANSAREELALIDKHQGFALSPLFGHKEDYSQYVPRGHYTSTPELQSYFRAMMWLSRRMFRVEETRPEGAGTPPDRPNLKGWHQGGAGGFPAEGAHEARAALLLVDLLARNQQAGAAHARITGTLRTLFGPADELGPDEARQLAVAAGLAGDAWTRADMNSLTKFSQQAATQAAPRARIDATGLGRLGFTLFGQATTFDTVVLQNLVGDEKRPMKYTGPTDVKPFTLATDDPRGPMRGYPRGLDLLAVLGSRAATRLLGAAHDADYEDYAAAREELRREYAALSDHNTSRTAETRAGGLSLRLLDAVAALYEPPAHQTDYMRHPLWARKQLLTGLGAWTALRHDTTLYAKQSYTSIPKGGMQFENRDRVVEVEAVPRVFERLEQLVAELNGALGAAGARPPALEKNAQALQAWLHDLRAGAQASAQGETLPPELARRLGQPTETVKAILHWPGDLAHRSGGQPDPATPLVADVHTRAPLIVQEALGRPLRLTFARRAADGRVLLLEGAVFSQYEFKQSMNERLTDEQWRRQLDSPQAPGLPDWMRTTDQSK